MKTDIQSIAFELFRQWTKNVAFDYPELDFTIVDERVLVTDLKKSLKAALNSLMRIERAEKRDLPGYDYGFIIGFIQANINLHWCFEYITKRSKAFKRFLINKALIQYLEFDPLSAIKVKALYEKMYADAVNLESLEYDLPQKKISEDWMTKGEDQCVGKEEDNPVFVFLKNQNLKQILALSKNKFKNYLPDLQAFFSMADVRELIQDKENGR